MPLEPDYPFEDFARDYRDFRDAMRALLAEEVPDRAAIDDLPLEFYTTSIIAFMESTYEDQLPVKEIRYRAAKFFVMFNYLAINLHAFDCEDFAVYGSARAGALVNNHLLRAIHSTVMTKHGDGLKRVPTLPFGWPMKLRTS
jgi:hypothetical protein